LQVLERKKKEMLNSSKNENAKKATLETLIELQKEDPEFWTDEQITSDITNILFAVSSKISLIFAGA